LDRRKILFKYRKYIITILIISITFFIMCTPGKPEINVKQSSQDIESGGSFDFGTQEAQTTKEVDFTIENLGEGQLELTGVPFIKIEGTNSDSFMVTSDPSSTVAAGESTTFTIAYTPQSDGSKTASVYIENNDEDEITYQFDLNGDSFLSGTEDTDNWNKMFSRNTSETEVAYSMTIDSSNNIYVAGTDGLDWWIKKFDSDGNEDTANWNKVIDGNGGLDAVLDINADQNDNIYLAGVGTNIVSGSSNQDWWIKKFDSDGNEDTTNWNKMIDGNNEADVAYDIDIDGNGNLYIAGFGTNIVSGTSGEDWWIKKFDSDGNEDTTDWNLMYDGNNANDLIYDIDIDGNGDIYFAGYGYNIVSGSSNNDWWIKKFGSDGNEDTSNWNKMFDYNDTYDAVYNISTDGNNNVYAVGIGENIISGSSSDDWWIKKFDSDGNEDTSNWDKSFDGNNDRDTLFGISISQNNEIYLTGMGINIVSGSSSDDWWIKKFDSDGNEDTTNWNKMFDGNNDSDNAVISILDNNGNLYVGGLGYNLVNSGSGSDWWIKKFLD
jgi:hypothetical protein